MTTAAQAHAIFLTMPELEEQERPGYLAYRVRAKGFGALWSGAGLATLRVGSEEQTMLIADQRVFSVPDQGPASGWVKVNLAGIGEEDFRILVWKAWRNTAPARLANQY